MVVDVKPKDFVRLLVPPLFVQGYRALRRARQTGLHLSGDFHSWEEAMTASTGYDSGIILEKTKAALLKVKNRAAVYERDSVLFNEVHYVWPLLAGLMWVAARCGGKLNVLDFGGSLGSTYFQNQVFLSILPGVRWNIVEQSRYVETGKAWFEDDRLRFYADIADCLADTQPNVVLLSSVLQYLERPYTVFDQIQKLPCAHIIVDRTPFWAGPTDRLCVQTVPPSIYPGSYPSWIFSTPRFHAYLNETWQIMTEFDSLDNLRAPVRTIWQGMILERKKDERFTT
jgi:putative methyltransferase (TIGR04325 family)